jgi:transposase InsO family protein
MNERLMFVAAYRGKEETFSDLCERFQVSRKTGYKWVHRYEQGGPAALSEQSRAPRNRRNAVKPQLVDRVLAIRRKHPRWGPKKIRVILSREKTLAHVKLPVTSTIGEILKRHGLSARKKRIRRSCRYLSHLREYSHANSVWCVDFKGHFATRSGVRCHPLTVTDGYSRKIIACIALRRPLYSYTRRAFEQIFQEYGLPDAIRTDNGPPFSSLAVGGLSKLSVWWIRLGIRPERIEPGRPDQNGRHERMHRTLKAETARPPKANFSAQQRAFDDFKKEYNEVRPHEALGQRTPDSLYRPSAKAIPKWLRPPDYPKNFRVRRTYPNGVLSFGSVQWHVSGCLASQPLGLEELDQDRWRVYFGPIILGEIDFRDVEERGTRRFGKLIRTEFKQKRRYKK